MAAYAWRLQNLAAMDRTYFLTPAGRSALFAKQTGSVPIEYKRILSAVEFQGHSEVIRSRLRRFSDQLIDEWLQELEDLGLIDHRAAEPLEDITFTGKRPPSLPPLLDVDSLHLAKHSVVAGATLVRDGCYLAHDRVANLPPLGRRPGETVIQLVEDDPDQIALAELRLKMSGYVVRVAPSSKELSRALREQSRPDLILLDVVLPDGDGFDILGKLRARPEFALLPIVLLTVKAELADIRNGLRLGADGYITKPYSKNLLAEVICRVLKQPSD
jgi:CheY-like chemotaxis protein